MVITQNFIMLFGSRIPPSSISAYPIRAMISMIFISGFRLIASDAGIVIAASWWGKTKTVSQMLMIIVMMLQIPQLRILEIILMYAALALTVISLVDYIVKNREVLTKGGM